MRNFLLFAIFLLFFPQQIFAAEPIKLNIFVEKTISKPLVEILRIFSSQNNIFINASFDDSDILEAKITGGEAADIIITSNSNVIKTLKFQGVIDASSSQVVVDDNLILVIDQSSHFREKIKSLSDERKFQYIASNMVILTANKEISGYFAKNYLSSANIIVDLLPLNFTHDMLELIALSGAAGICFESDIANQDDLEIAMVLDKNIKYQTAIIAGENMVLARSLGEFMKSETAQSIFRKYGFNK